MFWSLLRGQDSDGNGVNINAATFQHFENEEIGQLLSRVFLIEPSKVETRTRRKGTSKRKPDLTRSELRDRAGEHGVREWYQTIETELGPLFKTPETTRSSLSFKADLSNTRFGIQTGTIFSLWPDPARWPDHRDPQDGALYFQVYTYRLAALLDVSEETIRELLPDSHADWDYAGSETEKWIGVDGFFQADKEVEAFVEDLTELVV